MENLNTVSIVLAAGQGKRMNSTLPKVAHLLLNKPLIVWVIESLLGAGIKSLFPVISQSQNSIKNLIESLHLSASIQVHFAYQNEQKGTAHAVDCGVKEVGLFFENELKEKNFYDNLNVVVAYGDTPAIKSQTFKNLLLEHNNKQFDFTVLGFNTKNPYGYGRILVNEKSEFIAIREQKDCSKEEESIELCNSGILCASYRHLIKILPLVENKNAAEEFYLTEVPFLAKKNNLKVGLVIENDEIQFLGINTQEQLISMENNLRK